MSLDLGAMRDVIRFERRSTTQDPSGDPLLEWIFVAEVRANYKPSGGSEVFSSSQRQGRVPSTFSLRYREGLLPSMRLSLLGWDKVNQVATQVIFNILAVTNPDGVKVEHLIVADELVEEKP